MKGKYTELFTGSSTGIFFESSAVLNEPDNQLPPFNGDVHRLSSSKPSFFQPVAFKMQARMLTVIAGSTRVAMY